MRTPATVLPRVTSRLPAVLVAVVGATAVSAIFGLSDHGVATVEPLDQRAGDPGAHEESRQRRDHPHEGVALAVPLVAR